VTTPPPQDPFGSPPGWGQGQYGQGQYGQGQPGEYGPTPQAWGGAGYGGPTQTEIKAVIALVLAIASWLLFPLIPAIAALFVGSAARRDIEASAGRLTGDGLVTAAKVVAWINIGLSLAGLVLAVLAFGLFAVAASAATP
jgi:hypothetical protein